MSYTHCSPRTYLSHVTNSRASSRFGCFGRRGPTTRRCLRRTARRDTFTRARVKRLERHHQSKLAEDTFTGARVKRLTRAFTLRRSCGEADHQPGGPLCRDVYLREVANPHLWAWQPLGILRGTEPQGERPVVVTRSSTEVKLWRQWVLWLAPERET